eukprot:TRINITY_DN699_c0_g1_i1.p1 TRINITY_DN699_c0_g1~~TRINITY_DN699_c0_g1_i1.p1  ORF type:complete len:229 (+),score=41.98 TRINITY_DN699_c0_g1_i1:125-811(+)
MPPKKLSEKAKAKKEARKKAKEKEIASANLIKSCYGINYMDSFKTMQNYKKNGLDITLSVYPVDQLSPEDFMWAFNLVKDNFKQYYEQTWGWSSTEKKKEMKEKDALYLVARNAEGKPKGFAHFRFSAEKQKDAEVLYLYEMVLEEDIRGKGLGRHLVLLLELMALRYKMKYLIMNIFRADMRAVNFFRNHLRYTLDDLSPSVQLGIEGESEGYEIYSKCFVKPAPKK